MSTGALIPWVSSFLVPVRKGGRKLSGLAAVVLAALLWLPAPAGAQVLVQIGQNFTASTLDVDSTALPPDCNGAAGPNHYVELINGRFSVYNKTNASRVKTSTDLVFWSQAGVTVAGSWDVTDPRIAYDPTVQRWFAAAVDYDPTGIINYNHFLLAVSTTADPSGTWKGASFLSDTNGVDFADFPRLGLDAQGVYLSGDTFDASGNAVGSSLVAIPKADLLGATPIITNRTSFGRLAYATYGYLAQPAVCVDGSGQGNVLSVGGLGYDFITGDFKTQTTLVSFVVTNLTISRRASLTNLVTLTVPQYAAPPYPTQPDGTSNLDDSDARFSAMVYTVGGVLYAVHNADVNNRAALRWYRINATNHVVLESGTISDPVLDLIYPSIAANASGTVVIGFNGCSQTTYVSSYAVVGQRVNGVTTFGSRLLLHAGVASYQDQPGVDPNSYLSRWGDYSATCVDPADPNRFWTIQMYPSASSTWSTQITELLTAVPKLAIARAGTNVVLSWPGTAIAFNLQSKTNLSGTNWVIVTGTFPATNGLVYAQVPVTPGLKFFRLQQR